jgi:hypothetical protein
LVGAAAAALLVLPAVAARAEDLPSTPLHWMTLLPQAPLPSLPATALEGSPAEERSDGFMAGRFLVGVNTSGKLTPDEALASRWSVAPFVRNTPKRTGWGPSFGLSWFTGDVSIAIDGRRTPIGEVKVRPVMAGVGYSLDHGRARTTLSLVAGYAFTSAKVTAALSPGAEATIDIGRSWVVRPNVGVTVALTRRLALVGSVGYVYTNPTITIGVTRPGEAPIRLSGTFRSDYVNVSVGTAFSIF